MGQSNKSYGNGVNRTCYRFRFYPAGSSGSTELTLEGGMGVRSVVRNGSAGEYLVTLTKKHRKCAHASAKVQMASATDLNGQIATISNLGSTTLPITFLVRALAGATPTEIAANANNSISVDIEFEDTLAGS